MKNQTLIKSYLPKMGVFGSLMSRFCVIFTFGILYVNLTGCANGFKGEVPKPLRTEIQLDSFRLLVAVKSGDKYDLYLRCYPGYSLSKREILGQEMDCDAETIAGRSVVTLDVTTIQNLAVQLLEAQCVKP